MILNLDSTFNPYPNLAEVQFQSFVFSGGEPHIKISTDLSNKEMITISHRLNSFNDFGLLLLAIDAVKRFGVSKINVFIPYFPAARQDRLMIKGEPLSVKVYADILNQQNLNRITVFDPHSEVTPALLNNSQEINNYKFIQSITEKIGAKDLILVSPDGGALKKIYKLAANLKSFEVVEGSKSRDVKTGHLSGFKVYTDDLKGRDCLVVDDICDGGGTFLGLAEELKKKNAGKLYLAVSHGIFNKGFDALLTQFENVFTTDSFRVITESGVVQIKLNEII